METGARRVLIQLGESDAEMVETLGATSLPGLVNLPPEPRAIYLFAHGAGAGMEHHFMEAMAARLEDRQIAVLRWNFPYMAAGRPFPDRPPRLVAAVRVVRSFASRLLPELPVFAGGKSMGGRMASTAEAESPLSVSGLVFLGFPLHPAGKPSTTRADHLKRVGVPMTFIRGERDALADPELMSAVLTELTPSPELITVQAANHTFEVLKRSGRDPENVLDEVADLAARGMKS